MTPAQLRELISKSDLPCLCEGGNICSPCNARGFMFDGWSDLAPLLLDLWEAAEEEINRTRSKNDGLLPNVVQALKALEAHK